MNRNRKCTEDAVNQNDIPEKGLNLRIQECKENIANAVNEAKLPPGVLLMIFSEFTIQVQSQNARMISDEKRVYEESLEKTPHENEVNNNGKEIHTNK